MYKRGHDGLNALLYAPIAVLTTFFLSIELTIIGGVLFIGVARLPDTDRHFDSSMDTNRTELLEYIPITHRGLTHTIWFAVATGGILAPLAVLLTNMFPQNVPQTTALIYGFLTGTGGVLTHLLGDFITPTGIKPFTPISKNKYTLNICDADNKLANYGFLLTGGTAVLLALAWSASTISLTTLI
jgi:inner membrane protein